MKKDEELIESLKYISNYFGISKSRFTFEEIIDFNEDRLEMFILGVDAIGLKAYKTKIDVVNEDMIPFVLFEEDSFLIVKELKGEVFTAVKSNELDIEIKIDLEQMNEKLSREVLLIKDSVNIPTKFYKNSFTNDPSKWFITVIKDNLSIYSQILLTALRVLEIPCQSDKIISRIEHGREI